MSTLVAELLQDPALPGKVAVLQHALETERERRHRFYDEITEEQKAEFINGEIIMHSPAKSGSGEVASSMVRGFRIPIRALFDDAENLRVLRAILE